MIKNISNRHAFLIALLLLCGRTIAQPGSQNFGKVWMQGGSLVFTTTFNNSQPPVNQIAFPQQAMPPYLVLGHANICDSAGNVILASDGFNLYDKNLQYLDGGKVLVPPRIFNLDGGFSSYEQAGIILPFDNGQYKLITPTVSDDSCYENWILARNWNTYDLLLCDEIDMNANGGAGKVTKRMVPLLQNVRLAKCQMMACRHGDGKSWWLIKRAADTNMYYKFLFTQDRVYGPYIQGFGGEAAYLGNWDRDGQSTFSEDGTKFATTIQGYGKVFVADFDRCSGNLSNPKVYKVPAQLSGNINVPSEMDSSTIGVCFSPNSRFLYVCGFYNVQQLDLQNATSASGWTKLSGIDTSWNEFQQYITIYSGPNDKLYIGNLNGFAGQMSVIDAPDNKGTAASFCRKCLRFPGFLYDTTFVFVGVGGPPCMPNYALGPATPICYPTGISTPNANVPSLDIFPNPAAGYVNVRSSEAGSLVLYDVAGRIINTFQLQSSVSRNISIEDLSAGIYTYTFQAAGGGRVISKLVVK